MKILQFLVDNWEAISAVVLAAILRFLERKSLKKKLDAKENAIEILKNRLNMKKH